MKKFTSYFLMLIIALGSLLNLACPKKSDIEKGADYSVRLAGIVSDFQDTAQDAFRKQIITLETKDKIQTHLLTASKAGERFNTAFRELIETYGTAEKIPKDEIAALDVFFSQHVVGSVLSVIEIVGLLNAEQVSFLNTALSALRTAILAISAALGNQSASFIKARELNYV